MVALRSPKVLVSLAAIVLVLSAGVYFFGLPGPVESHSAPSRFTIGGRTFGITYVATDQAEWQRGLMNRKITDTTTMLFIFPEPGIYPFWMYDTNSSLDIIWLNVTGSTGAVVYMATDAPSCYQAIGCPNYTPSAAANCVIEAKAGFAARNGVTVGTIVRFS
jgi:uncharacterized membrane protein (UPF0127 family)